MKKINKITFISAGVALGAAAIVTPTAILLAHPTRSIENGLINSVPTFNKESLKNIEGSQPTKEQTQENKIRHVKVGKLLSLIQVKYGGVFKAEGTKEFLELQKLLNVGSND